MKMKQIVLNSFSFLILLSIIGDAYLASCPTEIELKQCLCNAHDDGSLNVTCLYSMDADTFARDLSNLRSYKIKQLYLKSMKIENTLPGNLFNSLEITSIYILTSNLKFAGAAFNGLDGSLQLLYISNSTISENFAIEKLSNLKKLYMYDNALGVVRNNWLNGKTPNIDRIQLDRNEITEIQSRAFSELSLLEKTSLAQNRIKNLERNMFPQPASKLTYINLSENEIFYLPEDLFTAMPVLELVNLEGNSITALPEITWKTMWQQLNSLYLYDNNLICDGSLDWLMKVKWPEYVSGNCVAPSSRVGQDLKEIYRPDS